MALWTSTSPGKPTRLASEIPKVSISRGLEAREMEGPGGGFPSYSSASPTVGEFWLGLEKVHLILGGRGGHLAVQLQDWEGNAESLQFPVHLGGEDTAYSLQLTAPVASKLGATTVMPSGLSLPFSTWDQDHDLRGDKNCAKSLSGEQVLSLFVLTAGPSHPCLSASLPFLQPFHPFSSSPYLLCALW